MVSGVRLASLFPPVETILMCSRCCVQGRLRCHPLKNGKITVLSFCDAIFFLQTKLTVKQFIIVVVSRCRPYGEPTENRATPSLVFNRQFRRLDRRR